MEKVKQKKSDRKSPAARARGAECGMERRKRMKEKRKKSPACGTGKHCSCLINTLYDAQLCWFRVTKSVRSRGDDSSTPGRLSDYCLQAISGIHRRSRTAKGRGRNGNEGVGGGAGKADDVRAGQGGGLVAVRAGCRRWTGEGGGTGGDAPRRQAGNNQATPRKHFEAKRQDH